MKKMSCVLSRNSMRKECYKSVVDHDRKHGYENVCEVNVFSDPKKKNYSATRRTTTALGTLGYSEGSYQCRQSSLIN